jgi:NAD-dependent dihydropyrimidine dehydrogenase PreA subunit
VLWIFFHVHHRRKNGNKVVCVVESNCSGCRRCVKRCSHRVLEMEEDESGVLHAAVSHPDKCTACGNCLDKCKFKALKLVERL